MVAILSLSHVQSFTICGPANSRADVVVHSIRSWQHSKTEFQIGRVIAHPFK